WGFSRGGQVSSSTTSRVQVEALFTAPPYCRDDVGRFESGEVPSGRLARHVEIGGQRGGTPAGLDDQRPPQQASAIVCDQAEDLAIHGVVILLQPSGCTRSTCASRIRRSKSARSSDLYS